MKKTTAVSVFALGFALVGGNMAPQLGLGIAPAAAQQKAKGPTVNQKVGKPLDEARQLVGQKKYRDALAKIQEAERVEGKSAYESYLTAFVSYGAYIGIEDWTNAAKAVETMMASGQMSAEDTTKFTRALIQIYYSGKNYTKVVEWGQKYNKDAQDPDIQILIAQALYLQKNLKASSEAAAQAMKYASAKGIAPKEDWLKLQLSAEFEQNNNAGVQAVLEQLVQRYPQPNYWQQLLSMMEKTLRSGGTKGTLDVYRLMLASGTMKESTEYMEMAQIAIQQGLPGEAKTVVEKGMKAGVLGQGTEKERHQRLLNMANTQSADDQKKLASGAAEAEKQKTGDAEVQFGEAYASYGQYDKAVELIQRGIGKGVKDKDDAQLRLGLTYLAAGKRPQAQDAFKQITQNTPSAQLARLWLLVSPAAPGANGKQPA